MLQSSVRLVITFTFLSTTDKSHEVCHLLRADLFVTLKEGLHITFV